jgi:hypothetical protein
VCVCAWLRNSFVDLLRTYAQTHTRSSAANGTRQEPSEAPAASRNQPWVGENIEPDKGFWMARQIMYRGGNHPTPVNCKACKSDPRPRNCGGHADLPACCEVGAKEPCDGKVLPTSDKDRGKDYNHRYAQCSTVQYSTVQCTAQRSASTAQCSTVQSSTLQHSTAQCSTVRTTGTPAC